MKRFGLVACFVFLGISAALWFFQHRNTVVAEVGAYKITQEDVQKRLEVIKVLNPNSSSNPLWTSVALEQMIRTFEIAEVLAKSSHPVTEAQLESATHELSDAKDEKAVQIHRLFGSDTKLFQRIYVFPILVERLALHDLFMKEALNQNPLKEKADAFLTEATRAPGKFEEISAKEGLMIRKGSINPKSGLVWEDGGRQAIALPNGPGVGKTWYEMYLKGTPPRQVYSKLIEFGNFWIALKNQGSAPKDKGTLVLSAALLPKPNFGVWLNEQIKAIPVVRTKTLLPH